MAARGLGSAAQGFKEFTDGRAAKAGGGARTGQDLAVGKVLGVHDDVDRAFAGDLVGVQAEGVDGHGAATFGHRGVTGARWGLPPVLKPYTNCAPSAPTGTSEPTGPGTSSRSTSATTRPATVTGSYSPPDRQHPHQICTHLGM